jgi:hypothetical protein
MIGGVVSMMGCHLSWLYGGVLTLLEHRLNLMWSVPALEQEFVFGMVIEIAGWRCIWIHFFVGTLCVISSCSYM